jgi:hypothetical protein
LPFPSLTASPTPTHVSLHTSIISIPLPSHSMPSRSTSSYHPRTAISSSASSPSIPLQSRPTFTWLCALPPRGLPFPVWSKLRTFCCACVHTYIQHTYVLMHTCCQCRLLCVQRTPLLHPHLAATPSCLPISVSPRSCYPLPDDRSVMTYVSALWRGLSAAVVEEAAAPPEKRNSVLSLNV